MILTKGYSITKIYEKLNAWYDGECSLSEVEYAIGARRPFLRELFFEANIVDCNGKLEPWCSYQTAFNLFMLYLSLLGAKHAGQSKHSQP